MDTGASLLKGGFNDLEALGSLRKYVSDAYGFTFRIDWSSSTYRNVGTYANCATEPDDFLHRVSIRDKLPHVSDLHYGSDFNT